MIKIKAEAIGSSEEESEAVLASYYTYVIAENGVFDKANPLLLLPVLSSRR